MTWSKSGKDQEWFLAAGGADLVADVESFLSGGYANRLRQCGEAVPGWARLNAFAHGDVKDLVQMCRQRSRPRFVGYSNWPEEAWRVTQQVLATEILNLVDGAVETLRRLQRTILVPLELELLNLEAQAASMTALELLQLTRAALRSSIA
jgi:hypothetical protein